MSEAALRRLIPAALVLLLFTAACGGPSGETPVDPGQPGTIKVVCTVGMISDAARIVGGDRVTVTGLMGPGIDPHTYRASANDVSTLSGADLILYNGLHLEARMGEVFERMVGRVETVAVTRGIPGERLLTPPQFEGQHDPHVWFDVSLWKYAVAEIAEALAARDPDHAGEYRSRAAAYAGELDDLDAYVKEQAARVPETQRVMVTAHDAFNYFGRRYDIEVRGLLGISTASEAGTADVKDLAAFIAGRGIPAIFVESSVPRRNLEAVVQAVRALGSAVTLGGELFSDAMGTAGTPEGTYLGMVRHNIDTVVSALLAGGGGTAEEGP